MPTHDYDEDIDNIMASIQKRQQGPSDSMQAIKPAPKVQPYQHDKEKPHYSKPKSKTPSLPIQQHLNRRHKFKKSFKITLVILFTLLGCGAASVAFKDKISASIENLMAPPSPFTQETLEKAGYTLYYPTRLPGSFKMEKNSISQTEGKVIIYAITDNDGKRLNITLQDKPAGLNLDPLYEVMSDITEIETDYGTIKIGKPNDEERELANIVTEKTWIIFSSPIGTLTPQQYTEIINSLKPVDVSNDD